MTARRRRGLLLLSVALASGGLAASQVHDRERRAAEQIGPPVDVLVAARDLPAGARIVRGAVAIRAVPARFVPPDALASAAGVVGARVAVPIARGGYLTAGLFEGAGRPAGETSTRKGERAVTVEVAGGSALAGLTSGTAPDTGFGGASGDLASGTRVDVLVSTETVAGGGRTVMALAGAELLQLGETGGGYSHPEAPTSTATGPTALATLRVSLRQAIYLTAADNFAREIRLLARPPGDHSRAGAAVSQGQL